MCTRGCKWECVERMGAGTLREIDMDNEETGSIVNS